MDRLMNTVKIKRVYEEPSTDDGYRILVDCLWPQGVVKKKTQLDEWCKDVAPSTELRKWFGHKKERFEEFERRYREELSDKKEELSKIVAVAHVLNITLLYAAKDTQINHAVVLCDVLEEEFD